MIDLRGAQGDGVPQLIFRNFRVLYYNYVITNVITLFILSKQNTPSLILPSRALILSVCIQIQSVYEIHLCILEGNTKITVVANEHIN
jgi:hypothetical protein